MLPDARELPADSNERCFAGSGECQNRATHSIIGDEVDPRVFICAHHLEEFEAWEERFAKLQRDDPVKFKPLEDAVETALAIQRHNERNPNG